MKKLIIGMVIILSMQTAFAVNDWPMFHNDLALTGYSTSSAPNTNDILWIYDTQSALIDSSPALAGGKLYIGSNDGNLYAIDAFDGSLLWTYPTGSRISSSPAVAEDKVYFLSTNGTCYAADAATGVNVWSTPIGSGPYDWSSPAVHNGSVFITSSTGTVYSLNAQNGSLNWGTFVGGSPDSPMAVANGKVYTGTHNFGTSSPTLVALDEATGIILWTYDYHLYHGGVVGMVNSNGAAIADGDEDGDLEVYFGVYNWLGTGPQAVCLDEATGVEVWATNINGDSTSTPAVHDGVVFIGSDDASLYALDAGTGAYIWDYPTGNAVWSAPAVADGKVFFGSLDHTVYAVDEATGALVWSYFTGASRIMGSPAVAYGNVYVGNENGKIYAFGSPFIMVNVDIKPQSCPNPLRVNFRGRGVFTVAIVGSDDFDVHDIDIATITLEGVDPIRSNFEDVSTPFDGEECECSTEGSDGILDLVLKFNRGAVLNALEDTHGDLADLPNKAELTLTLLAETSDGTLVTGTDCLRILNRGTIKRKK